MFHKIITSSSSSSMSTIGGAGGFKRKNTTELVGLAEVPAFGKKFVIGEVLMLTNCLAFAEPELEFVFPGWARARGLLLASGSDILWKVPPQLDWC